MTISTILLITLFLGLSLFSKVKKAVEEQGVPQGHPAVPGQGDGDAEGSVEDESLYFTYESDAENTFTNPMVKRQAPMAPMATVADEPVARPQFDLRQAVISQVILNNRYLDEINQSN